MKNVQKWFRQPTTCGGFAALLYAGSQWLSGAITWQAAIGLLVIGAVGLVWPTMTAAEKADIEAAVAAITKAAGDAQKAPKS